MDIYALYEKGREAPFLQFLRQNKKENNLPLAVVMESCEDILLDAVLKEQLCKKIVSHKAEQHIENRLSLYPSISRTTLYQMSVGVDTEWLSGWLRTDFEAGRRSIIMLDGLDTFTGKEPSAYRNMILGYIRRLLEMGVLFAKELEDVKQIYDMLAVPQTEAALPQKESRLSVPMQESHIYTPEFEGKLLQQRSLRRIPDGFELRIPKGMVITPLARDYIRDHNLKVIVEEYTRERNY